MPIVDLHCHSTASDGLLSPQELAQRAVSRGIELLALTDHDCIEGYLTLRDMSLPFSLLSGVELSCNWLNREIHIVGLDFDASHPALLAHLAAQRERRIERARAICEKLEQAGFLGIYSLCLQKVGHPMLTRAHIARILVAHRGVASMEDAFRRYLGSGERCYVRASWPSLAQTIEVIKQAGGKSVLAHPFAYGLNTKWVRRLLADGKAAGLDAVEVYGPQQNDEQRRLSLEVALQSGLAASTGSDMHQPSPFRDLGHNCEIPAEMTAIWLQCNSLPQSFREEI